MPSAGIHNREIEPITRNLPQGYIHVDLHPQREIPGSHSPITSATVTNQGIGLAVRTPVRDQSPVIELGCSSSYGGKKTIFNEHDISFRIPAFRLPALRTPILRSELLIRQTHGVYPTVSLKVEHVIKTALTAEEKTDLILEEIAEFHKPETWFNRDDTVKQYWKSTIRTFVDAFPLSSTPVEEALAKATIAEPINVFDTASGRGRLVTMDIKGIGRFRTLLVFNETGDLATVAISRFHGLGNVEELGDNFYEFPNSFKQSLLEKIGPYAAQQTPVRRNIKTDVQAPMAHSMTTEDLIHIFNDNPALHRLKNLLPSSIGLAPRLNHFNVRKAEDLGLYSDGTIFAKIDLPFSEETLAHEMIHTLWDSQFFTSAQKNRWCAYVKIKHPEIFDLVRNYYSKGVMKRSLFDDRAADEMLAYLFMTLANKSQWQSFKEWEHPISIDEADLREFVALGLIEESAVSYWLTELTRRKNESQQTTV